MFCATSLLDTQKCFCPHKISASLLWVTSLVESAEGPAIILHQAWTLILVLYHEDTLHSADWLNFNATCPLSGVNCVKDILAHRYQMAPGLKTAHLKGSFHKVWWTIWVGFSIWYRKQIRVLLEAHQANGLARSLIALSLNCEHELG